MGKPIAALGDWYVNHSSSKWLLIAAIMVSVTLVSVIGMSHPALAASPDPLIPPTTPDTSVAGPGTVIGAIILRVFGVILFIITTLAGLGAVVALVRVLIAMFRRSISKLKLDLLFLLGFLAVGGICGASGVGIFNATASAFGHAVGG